MYKIGVIGDRESALGFLALGFALEEVYTAKDAALALARMAKDAYAVIFIMEDLAMQLPEELAYYRKQTLPAVIVIPGKQGSTGFGMEDLRASVERAVGVDMLTKNESEAGETT